MKRRIYIALGMLLNSSVGHTAGAETGTVSPGWFVYEDSNVFFYLSGSHTGARPICATIPDRWAFDSSTAAGKAYLSALLSAYATGRSVTINGTNTCIHGNTESIKSFAVN